jgi:hypothetical protein
MMHRSCSTDTCLLIITVIFNVFLSNHVKGRLSPMLNEVAHHEDIRFLVKHQAIKTHERNGHTVSHILNLGTRWR